MMAAFASTLRRSCRISARTMAAMALLLALMAEQGVVQFRS